MSPSFPLPPNHRLVYSHHWHVVDWTASYGGHIVPGWINMQDSMHKGKLTGKNPRKHSMTFENTTWNISYLCQVNADNPLRLHSWIIYFPGQYQLEKRGCTSKQSQVHQLQTPLGHPDELSPFCLLHFPSHLWYHGLSVANQRLFKEHQECLLRFLSCLKSLFQSTLQRLALASFQLQPMAHLHTAQGRICSLSLCYYTVALTGNPYVSVVAI